MDGMKGLGGRAGLWDLPWGWPGLAGVPGGVAGLPSCVGGGEIPCWFSWWPGHVLVFFWPPDGASAPDLWPLPCMLSGPSWPLLVFSPCPECVTACVPFPCLGGSWPCLMGVLFPGLSIGWWCPWVEQCTYVVGECSLWLAVALGV